MKALVYHGPGKRNWETAPDPVIKAATDVIVSIDTTTICGTDLHILKGDVPATKPGTILGHEGIGTVVDIGSAVTTAKAGDHLLLSCVSACGRCPSCKKARYSACTGGGGWMFGHTMDGTQAEYVRVPFADTSTYHIPEGLADEQVLFLTDILPTSFEVGVLNGKVSPGDTVAVVGAGPIGLAAILTGRLFSPAKIIAIDLSDNRLEKAKAFGADVTINNGERDALAAVMELTDGLGVDVAIEAAGVPQTFELCADLVRPHGNVAVLGVFGKPASFHLERLWSRGITITTGLVDTYSIPRLLNLIKGGQLDATVFVTHHFPLDSVMEAYDAFSAPTTSALKVALNADAKLQKARTKEMAGAARH